MRNENTPWNRSYKGPAIDTADLSKLRVQARNSKPRSDKQKAVIAKHGNSKLFIGQPSVKCARNPHEDDIQLGYSRRKAFEKMEDIELERSLKEVWE